MIALSLALQLLGSTTPLGLTVRAGDSPVVLRVLSPASDSATGGWVDAEQLAISLGGTTRVARPGRHVFAVRGSSIEMIEGAPFARAGDVVLPLAAAPRIEEGRLLLPMHFVSEALPRLSTGLLYDRRLRELRVFSAAVGAGAGGGTLVAGSPPTAAERAERASPGTPRSPLVARYRVVVDAGHGGEDRGMSGPARASRKIYEKDVTLAVSRRLERALRERNVDVVMTRTRDTLIALADRGHIANSARGDLFLSIHVNAANPRWREPDRARGFETYFLAEAKTEDARRVEQMENEAVRFETGATAARDDPLSFIINDMAQNEHLRESSELAQIVQRRLARIHPGPDRGVKQAGFRVLVSAYMPSVLIEIGFGTNAEEAVFLSDARRQRDIAEAIADAALEYLAVYERRAATGRP